MAKTFDELTLMDDYMFAQVMREKKHLKPLLEHILGIKIVDIEFVEPQKVEKTGYEAKGVRFDLYVKDKAGVVYNVEIQNNNEYNLPRRMRYYQSVIDSNILQPGKEYIEMKPSYVIFICNYDEFKRRRYLYTFENICNEEPNLKLGDQSFKVVINTKGSRGDISDELKEAIKYLDDGTVTGNYSKELDDAVRAVKSSEERRVEYMLICARDNELIAKGDINRMKEDAKGMYEEGLSLDVIARIQKTTVDVVKKLLGLDQEPVAFG